MLLPFSPANSIQTYYTEQLTTAQFNISHGTAGHINRVATETLCGNHVLSAQCDRVLNWTTGDLLPGYLCNSEPGPGSRTADECRLTGHLPDSFEQLNRGY